MEKIGFLRSWRWFGPSDAISLSMIKQTRAASIVSSLHHIPAGEVWSIEEIRKLKSQIEQHGFTWSVVESLPIHESIKYRGRDAAEKIHNYKTSLANLGKCGLDTVCYNFMPVIDWIRTDLNYPWKDRGISMLFHYPTFVAFDMYILKRPNAEAAYPEQLRKEAYEIYAKMSTEERHELAHNIIVVTQGFIHGGVGSATDFKRAFLQKLDMYHDIDQKDLLANLSLFLDEVTPVAEEYGIKLCLHPDDPPFPVLGLPRIAGTVSDFQRIMDCHPSTSNGITFCAGSLSSRPDNDVIGFLEQFRDKIHFAHLRNTTIIDEYGSFCESGHLEGGVDMRKVIKIFHNEMRQRKERGLQKHHIPMRPDHGLKLEKDISINANPGYPFHGRSHGLDELVALENNLDM